MVTPDETGWRVGAKPHWLWTCVTPETTVYAICPGRSFDDAATLLGTDYSGVLVRDGWVVYRCYKGLHQSCINHLANRAKTAGRQESLGPGGPGTAFGPRPARSPARPTHRRPAADSRRPTLREFPAVFLFLRDPSIDATNWRAEQAIRPAVVIPKCAGATAPARAPTPSRC